MLALTWWLSRVTYISSISSTFWRISEAVLALSSLAPEIARDPPGWKSTWGSITSSIDFAFCDDAIGLWIVLMLTRYKLFVVQINRWEWHVLPPTGEIKQSSFRLPFGVTEVEGQFWTAYRHKSSRDHTPLGLVSCALSETLIMCSI